MDQELHKALAQKESAARQARLRSGGAAGSHIHHHHQGHHDNFGDIDKENTQHSRDAKSPEERARIAAAAAAVKRDFFGRVIVERPLAETDGNARKRAKRAAEASKAGRVWVTYNEGLNNAVRKPITLEEFLKGF